MSSMNKLGDKRKDKDEVRPNYECTDGVDPSTMTVKQYIKVFRKGPCSPAMVMAGIAATKLIISIDCKKLRNNHPDYFEICGWSTCSESILGDSPRSEYQIWIPEIISPFSLVNPFKSSY